MDINRFTQKAQEAISAAQSTAARYGHQQVDVEHLLAAGGLTNGGGERRAIDWRAFFPAC